MAELVYTHPTEDLRSGAVYGNGQVVAHTDAASNLTGLWNVLDAQPYCCRLSFAYRTYELGHPGSELEPLVTQFYPAYQETIFGAEGVIVAQRMFVPYRAGYAEAVCWQLDLQAEGHRLLQIEVTIDWGSDGDAVPLQQRYQDGLIVAQGGHSQRAARVFGANGPPTLYELDAGGRARLVYHVLIEGYVDLPFVLSVALSGEQLAWNGFLALGDAGLVFQDTVFEMETAALARAELITPAAALNRGFAWSRLNLVRALRRGRVGLSLASALQTVDTAVAAHAARALAWSDAELSRQVLQTLQRCALRPDGGLVAAFDLFSGAAVMPDRAASASTGESEPGNGGMAAATAAFVALANQFRLRGGPLADGDLAAAILSAKRWLQQNPRAAWQAQAHPDGLALAALWAQREALAPAETGAMAGYCDDRLYQALAERGWLGVEATSAGQRGLAAAASFVLAALEGVIGLASLDADTLLARPRLPDSWLWLLLLGLPYGQGSYNLILHQGLLYCDGKVAGSLPIVRCEEITRLEAEGIALLVREGARRRLFAANPGERPWQSTLRAVHRSLIVDLAPGEGRWFEL